MKRTIHIHTHIYVQTFARTYILLMYLCIHIRKKTPIFLGFPAAGFRVARTSQQGSLISGLFSFYLIAREDRVSYAWPRVAFYLDSTSTKVGRRLFGGRPFNSTVEEYMRW